MADILIVGIVVLIVGLAAAYILKAKKSGVKCIGCPSGGTCGCAGEKGDHGACSCHCTENATARKSKNIK